MDLAVQNNIRPKVDGLTIDPHLQQIAATLNQLDTDQVTQNPLMEEIRNATWIRIAGTQYFEDGRNGDIASLAEGSRAMAIGVLHQNVSFEDDFNRLVHTGTFEIYEIEDGEKGPCIYGLNLKSFYQSPVSGSSAWIKWQENNGALTKIVLEQTTRELRAQLHAALADPKIPR